MVLVVVHDEKQKYSSVAYTDESLYALHMKVLMDL